MNVLALFDGLVHLVRVPETKYEYGLTACRRDFAHHNDPVRFLERDILPIKPTTTPFTCLYCAIAPPSSGAGQEKES
jgi:hypothetical protein